MTSASVGDTIISDKEFKGVIKIDLRDSKADWELFLPPKAPDGAPDVLIILYDDTGQAAWQPCGGRINMPTLQRLADNGLTYTQWHTTALCSPTRSCFLTGHNRSGDGLCIGGDAVSEDYVTPGEFKNGTIQAVAVTVEKDQYLDLEKLAAAAMAVD